ncbi:hypothetical protein ABZ690_35185 [Streptomyces sp. NPDC006967]|uniref:hypothetical protein n=1 Tax=unclassified Streptomyces TaxID=2593676 RepID=UPI0033F867BA
MTSTPRLDSLAAGGTNKVPDGIRLADGHMLTLNVAPGGATAEVFLFPGLNAPDTEAWENEDQWEVWLTGGEFGDGSLYLDVPVDAVRDLIIQHGGEHENQEPEQTAPKDLDQELLAEMADLRGRFKDGYTPEDIRTVFYRIYDTTGIYLVCVWEYADQAGFGGNSQFYAEDQDGVFFEVQPDIHRWLSGQQDTPGELNTWVCARVTEPTDFPVSDDYHNYARADRTGD